MVTGGTDRWYPVQEARDGEAVTPVNGSVEPAAAAVRDAAERWFGGRLPLVRRYAELLVTDGVVRGVIGPREAPRIWERHLLNCVAIETLIPFGADVIDIGSGAGLPGIVLAVARPDLQVTLVESLARRTAFLTETVERLGLAQVRVVRGRAEDCGGALRPADVVTARAVASLDRLAAWGLPLVKIGGRLLAVKGESAAAEITDHGAAVARLGGAAPVLRECGGGVSDPLTTVVEIVRERETVPARKSRRGRGRDRR